ncbi:cytochrome d ubiquinol oxidase subunit II [Actinoplanes solisilvae]|uniref:cytochrome d ubiquinol oxidase subunit II n=1 Tax=Actinoplanes solisilvae TaxID=2486853 RepID=UPI000FDA581F|nr:cytochrome d ubiquinol oxidase subunit II [Actinoplanes solisilvae]
MAVTLVYGALLVTATLYVTFGGADFGAGFWNLLSARDPASRKLIDESVTPVWESNHVWLVFGLVLFFTGFPAASAHVWTSEAPALWLALLGIVARGVAFAFQAVVGERALLSGLFAASSILTPFFMGWVIGGVVGASPPAFGVLFVAAGAYLAATYLVREAEIRDLPALAARFARRAVWAAAVTGAVSVVCLVLLSRTDARLAGRLLGAALPLTVLAALCGSAVLVRLATGRTRLARPLAWVGVAAVVWAWGVAQHPLLVPSAAITVSEAAAPQSTLVGLLVVGAVAVVLVTPSFVLLFSLQARRRLVDPSATD